MRFACSSSTTRELLNFHCLNPASVPKKKILALWWSGLKAFVFMLTTALEKELATRKNVYSWANFQLFGFLKRSTFVGIAFSNCYITEISLFRCVHTFHWTPPLLSGDCIETFQSPPRMSVLNIKYSLNRSAIDVP